MNAHSSLDAGGLHPAVADLLAQGAGRAAIDAFLTQPFPLLEPGAATFAWRGEADHVHMMRWIHAGADREPFDRVPGTDLWLLRVPVGTAGRFEYKLAVGHDGREDWTLDPLNANRAEDPYGENSVCRTDGYEQPLWTMPQGAPEGRILPLDIDSAAYGWRNELVYLPAGFDPSKTYPLLMIHDGRDFLRFAGLQTALDNLIAAGDIPPLVAALTESPDRMGEYSGGHRHARYLVQELLPALESRFRLSPDPADRVLLGASLGAVASLATARRQPGRFGGLILFSGSFILDDARLAERSHLVFHRVARLVRALLRAGPLPPTRAYVSTGELEGLADQNAALATALRDRGVGVLFESVWDGHHWHNWRDRLREALRWVLPRNDQS